MGKINDNAALLTGLKENPKQCCQSGKKEKPYLKVSSVANTREKNQDKEK